MSRSPSLMRAPTCWSPPSGPLLKRVTSTRARAAIRAPVAMAEKGELNGGRQEEGTGGAGPFAGAGGAAHRWLLHLALLESRRGLYRRRHPDHGHGGGGARRARIQGGREARRRGRGRGS